MMVTVIGAGLAGSEAAWQLAERGFAVRLCEMKPSKMSPAHHSPDFAELVCSNSLRGDRLENAVGLLKEELRRLGSLILSCAEANRVEAGGALAVDRYGFSGLVTQKIRNHPNITVVEEEITQVPEGPVIIATGPLTSDAMSAAIQAYFGGQKYMSFFDAAAPLITFDSIDMDKAWFASRYDRGDADYVNCAMEKDVRTFCCGGLQILDDIFFSLDGIVFRFKVVFNVHAHGALAQIAQMPHARLDLILRSQVFSDCLCLRRRLDNYEVGFCVRHACLQ